MDAESLLLLVATLLSVCTAQDDPLNPVGYDEKYVEGVNAYTAKKWRKCIPYFKYVHPLVSSSMSRIIDVVASTQAQLWAL